MLVQGLRVTQPRIQAWLGRAAGAADALVVRPLLSTAQAADATAPAQQTMARWDPEDKLGLAVPFPEDQTLTVGLDKTLPMVIAEHLSSGNFAAALCVVMYGSHTLMQTGEIFSQLTTQQVP